MYSGTPKIVRNSGGLAEDALRCTSVGLRIHRLSSPPPPHGARRRRPPRNADLISVLPDDVLLLVLMRLRCVLTCLLAPVVQPLDLPPRSHLPQRRTRHGSFLRPQYPSPNWTQSRPSQLVAARRRCALAGGAILLLPGVTYVTSASFEPHMPHRATLLPPHHID